MLSKRIGLRAKETDAPKGSAHSWERLIRRRGSLLFVLPKSNPKALVAERLADFQAKESGVLEV
jgi:hypothetical protein